MCVCCFSSSIFISRIICLALILSINLFQFLILTITTIHNRRGIFSSQLVRRLNVMTTITIMNGWRNIYHANSINSRENSLIPARTSRIITLNQQIIANCLWKVWFQWLSLSSLQFTMECFFSVQMICIWIKFFLYRNTGIRVLDWIYRIFAKLQKRHGNRKWKSAHNRLNNF